jgi:hypothetical protein
MNFNAASTNRTIIFSVPADQPHRFYRLKLGVQGSAASFQINDIQVVPNTNQVRLTLSIPANLSCIIEWANNPKPVSWTGIATNPAVSTNRIIQWTANATTPSFYRLRSPL